MLRYFRRHPVLIALMAGLVGFASLTTLFGEHFLRRVLVTRQELWLVVNWVCRPVAAVGINLPCRATVAPNGDAPGYYVLRAGRAHFLTIPMTHISGIEDPVVLKPEASNYWLAAWANRFALGEVLGITLDRTDVGLAINSSTGRSQDQMHIHTACIRPQLRQLIQDEGAEIGATWGLTKGNVWGVRYQAMRIENADLGSRNVFDLLPEAIKADPKRMADQTLVVVGARFADGAEGFYVFNDQVNGQDDAAGEDLLDFRCRIAEGRT